MGGLSPLLLQGFLFGWSVAWPPGPINAEIMRRGIERGFAPAYAVALGAASGDACWAVAAATGAGLVLTRPAAHLALGVISTVLLIALGLLFLRGAWRGLATRDAAPAAPGRFESTRAGYGLGLGMSLTSPWNIGFWLAVMGRPEVAQRGFPESLVVAGAVMAGALTWCLIITSAVTLLRIRIPTRWWEVVAKGATGFLLLGFALNGLVRLAAS
ncbi:MAG TPA: LysE family transporter [Stellaceae bacterium]|nr:LysE family transporter [Stellaceae bacterium]